MTTKLSFVRVISTLALFAPIAACYDGGAVEDVSEVAPLDEAEGIRPDRGGEFFTALRGIDSEFADAAEEFGVPVQILQAVGYVETQWQMIEGHAEFEGQEPAFGVMALRGSHVETGAELVGASVDDVKYDRETNIRAAAALLSSYADEQEIDRSDLGAWALAIAAMSDIPVEDALANYIHHDVYGVIREGLRFADAQGEVVAEMQSDATVEPSFAAPVNPSMAPGPDYSGSVWRGSPNYSSRAGSAVRMVVIHSCEGNYAGCYGWLQNTQAGASAHYVIKEDGSEISQLVKESNMAWHVGATYDCTRNSNQECGLNGWGSNAFSVGIEHAGFAAQKSWHANLIDQSAKLTCDITKAHNIPRDKFHIVSHGQLQPWDRTDPGPNWPWATYMKKVNEHCGSGVAPQSSGGGSVIVVDSNPGNNKPGVSMVKRSENWLASAVIPGYYGSGYWFANTAETSDGLEFLFYLPQAATKTVDAWWTAHPNRSTGAPFVMFNSYGTKIGTTYANQQKNGSRWVTLGTFHFQAGWNSVLLSRWAEPGKVVVADAVRIR